MELNSPKFETAQVYSDTGLSYILFIDYELHIQFCVATYI